jgi:hypothetical protein
MPKKYIAIHDGHTWKRTTANRNYTHAIIKKVSIAASLDEAAESARASWRMNFSYLVYQASGKPFTFDANGRRPFTLEAVTDPAVIERAKALLLAGVEPYVAESVGRHAAWIKTAPQASDGLHYYLGANWAGRPDLAQRAAKPGDIILTAEVAS